MNTQKTNTPKLTLKLLLVTLSLGVSTSWLSACAKNETKQQAAAENSTAVEQNGSGFDLIPAANAAGPTKVPSIGRSMKAMNQSLKQAKAAQSVDEFKTAWQSFKTSVHHASLKSPGGSANEVQTYQQGIEALKKTIADIDNALQNNDLNTAKAGLNQLKSLERDYHSQLGV